MLFLNVVLLWSITLKASEQKSVRPNVLMIVVDDLRPMLGCYGDPHIQTPNIDQLAAQGVVFERAYCQYAKCGPSRLSLMTGLRPDAVNVFSHRDKDVREFRQRRPDAVSIARWLKNHGYCTQGFGKIYHDGWDNPDDWSVPSFPGRTQEMLEITNDKNPQQPTFIAERLNCPVMQNPDVSDDHLFAGRMTNKVLKVMQSEPRKPWFLAVGYRRPHLPFVAPEKYFRQYQPDESWLPKNPLPGQNSSLLSWFNSDGYVGSARKVGLTMPTSPNREQGIAWNGYEMRSYVGVPNHGTIERELQLKLYQAYAACVSYVDAQIGRLLNELQRQDRMQKTVIVLLSDHGWHLGEHSAWGKMTNFEIATRVPLIIAAPGIVPARTSHISELVDLYPTLCDLTNTPQPAHLQGESLACVLNAPQQQTQDVAISQYSRFNGRFIGRTMRTDRYRLIQWHASGTGNVEATEVYDHDTDPNESHNLSSDRQHADLVQSLCRQMAETFATYHQ